MRTFLLLAILAAAAIGCQSMHDRDVKSNYYSQWTTVKSDVKSTVKAGEEVFKEMELRDIKSEATVLEVRGDWNGALRWYQNLLVLQPDAVNLNRDIARCLRNLGRFDEAQQAIDRHLAMSPYGAESNIEAARIRIAKNDVAGARTHLERAAHILARADAGYAPAADVKKLMAEIGAR